MAMTYDNFSVSKVTFDENAVKLITLDGVEVFRGEKTLANITSAGTWDCRGYNTLTFDFAVSGSWWYWASGSGTVSGRSVTFTMYAADGTTIYTSTKSYDNTWTNYPNKVTDVYQNDAPIVVDISSLTDNQKAGIYIRGAVRGNADNPTNFSTTVNSTAATNGVLS